MKYLKALLVLIITVFTFGGALAQTKPHHPHHRHHPHRRHHPHHRHHHHVKHGHPQH